MNQSQTIASRMDQEAAQGGFHTSTPRINEIARDLAFHGIIDDRLAMVRIDFPNNRADVVYARDRFCDARVRVQSDEPEISSVVQAHGIRFFESPTPNILGQRMRLARVVNALANARAADGKPTQGVVLGDSGGRMLHEQFMQVGKSFEPIEAIRSIRYDPRREMLIGIRIAEGRICRDVVVLRGADVQEPDAIHDPAKWTAVAQVTDANIVSLSKLRVRRHSVDLLVNLQRGGCRRLSLEPVGDRIEAVWSEDIPMRHVAIGVIPGKPGVVLGYLPHRGEIEFVAIRPERTSSLAIYASS